MLNSEYFMNDCYFSWVRNYLGPEGTQRLDDPQIYRDFVVEDIEREHSMEEENIGLKRKEHEVINTFFILFYLFYLIRCGLWAWAVGVGCGL